MKIQATNESSLLVRELARGRRLAKRYSIGILRRLLFAATRPLLGTVSHVVTDNYVAALTFDDGPDPQATPLLLDILKKHKAKGTFFMLGKAAARYPDIVQRAASEGHAIGNHTWNHPSFPLVSRRQRIEQIRKCAGALGPYGQKIFRPPYGHQSLSSRLDVLSMGYKVIGWNLVGMDWLDHEAEWMADKVINGIKPGSVINFHDALVHFIAERHVDRTPMLRAVDLILQKLEQQFEFVTIPELLRRGRAVRRHWYLEPDVAFLNQLKSAHGQAWQYRN